eukprot:TRINITY_DN4129_c0_g1_i2.p2 TRINITY_DN4129_c0_g1~~TRINITY_DN4129_c0_g1_i2.p2  ORF type:complete len:210 (-),score=49.87 TRINITY_DN4129_c0_g1_i2:703-1332(-)
MGSSSSKVDFAELAQETRLDHEEMKQIMKVFSKMANKEGYITREKFRDALQESLNISDPSFAASLYNVFDRDGSSKIDAREFILAIAYISNKSVEDVVEVSFRAADLNSDGFISKGELRSVSAMNERMRKYINVYNRSVPLDKVQLTPLETTQVHEKADKLFKKLDTDGSGTVSEEEFKRLANSDPELKKELTQLLVKDEGINILSPKK